MLDTIKVLFAAAKSKDNGENIVAALNAAIDAAKESDGLVNDIEAVWESLVQSDVSDDVLEILSNFRSLIGDDYEKLQSVVTAVFDSSEEIELVYQQIKDTALFTTLENILGANE